MHAIMPAHKAVSALDSSVALCVASVRSTLEATSTVNDEVCVISTTGAVPEPAIDESLEAHASNVVPKSAADTLAAAPRLMVSVVWTIRGAEGGERYLRQNHSKVRWSSLSVCNRGSEQSGCNVQGGSTRLASGKAREHAAMLAVWKVLAGLSRERRGGKARLGET